MNNGFVRVAAAIPELRVADCAFNVACMADLVHQGEAEKVQVIVFLNYRSPATPAAICFFNNNYLPMQKRR